MAWIEVHQTLPTHRKTLALADSLDIVPAQAMGHLITFWLWALDNAPTGSLQGITPGIIARVAQWEGDPNAFVDALLKAGFFEATEDGLEIHDWYDYAGRLIEQRQANADRSRAWREQKANMKNTEPVANAYGMDTEQIPNIPTVPYPTVPKELKDTCPSTDTDGCADESLPDGKCEGAKEKPRKPFSSLRQQTFFEQFWDAYPRKQGKGQAARAWLKITPDESFFAEIMTGLGCAKNSAEWARDGGRYIPNPSTWLNGTRWEDVYTPKARGEPRLSANTAQALEIARKYAAKEGILGDTDSNISNAVGNDCRLAEFPGRRTEGRDLVNDAGRHQASDGDVGPANTDGAEYIPAFYSGI